MYEELITKGESITDSPHEKIMILKKPISHGWNKTLAESQKIVELSKSYDSNLIKEKLVDLVPEYIPDPSNILIHKPNLPKSSTKTININFYFLNIYLSCPN